MDERAKPTKRTRASAWLKYHRAALATLAFAALLVLGVGVSVGTSLADINARGAATSAEQASTVEASDELADEEADATSDAAAETADDEAAETAAFTIPDYEGEPSVQVGDGVPDFTEEEIADAAETGAFESYSELDELGRCGVAYALVGTETLPTEERGSIGEVKPSGWHLVTYDFVDGRYLYNRCHLIAYQLTAENANECNLITGTRTMNVEGMLPYENEVADYVEETGNHVLYRVTPVFVDDELVARGVRIEAWSLEDDGAGVCFDVYCFNVEPGVEIDYATGDSWLAEDDDAADDSDDADDVEADADDADDASDEATAADETEQSYVLNTRSMRFHYPDCSSVDDMSDSNREDYYGTRQDLIDQGYVPCGRCNP